MNVVTPLVLVLRLGLNQPQYEGRVRLEMHTPQFANVALFDPPDYVHPRDELAANVNNFLEVVRAPEVRARTGAALGLQGVDAAYALGVTTVAGTSLIEIRVIASSPLMAGQIADTHASTAMENFAELRRRIASQARGPLAAQIELAQARFQTVQDAMVLQERLNRNSRVDEQNLRQAREQYMLILNKYRETVLKEDEAIQPGDFLNIVGPTVAQRSPDEQFGTLLGLTVLGSAGVSVLLAMLTDKLPGRL